QCTQARRIFSASAVCGSASCARVKEVCITYAPVSQPSWPGLSRPSTSRLRDVPKVVDARHKAGHDGRVVGNNVILNPRPHAPRIEHALGVEALLHALA